MPRLKAFWLALLAGLMAGVARADDGEAAAGRLVAQTYCGGCHAVGEGASPFSDAPPFRTLYRRYPEGRLAQILAEGMIAPIRPPEEGEPVFHPRMPMAELGEDQLAALTAYLRSLDPRSATGSSGR